MSYADSSSGVFVDLDNHVFRGGAKGDDTRLVESVIGSMGEDNLAPRQGGNAFGGDGNDTLRSIKGAALRGDAGKDKLIGDPKKKYADTFWVQKPGDGPEDTILKFDKGQDSLKVSGSKLGFGRSLNADELLNRSNGHESSGVGAQFIYEKSGKALWYDPDGSGSQHAAKSAVFKGGPASLGVSDFDLT